MKHLKINYSHVFNETIIRSIINRQKIILSTFVLVIFSNFENIKQLLGYIYLYIFFYKIRLFEVI